MRRTVLIALLFVWFAAAAAACSGETSTPEPTMTPPPTATPDPNIAPDFTLTTFSGDDIRLSDLRGQIVVINFWASWCGPCHTEADILQEVSEAYADDGVVLLGLAYRDIPESALDFIDRYAITYANGDGTEIADAYGVQGVPETFIIGPDGRIVENGMILGPVTSGTLYPLLEDLIAAAS